MSASDSIRVRDKDGVHGTIVPVSPHTSKNASQVLVQLESGQQLLVPADSLVPQSDGSYYLTLSLAELEYARIGGRADSSATLVVPVLVEQHDVQKRVVETGKVRITKRVHEHEALVDEPLLREEVEVTRVPMQRVVDGPIPVRDEDGTLIISILEEVLVVEKRLMLKEEIHIRKHRVETRQPQQVILRSEEVDVERLHITAQREGEL